MPAPGDLRIQHIHQVTAALFRRPGLSRTDLAAELALSKATVTQITQALIEHGLLAEVDRPAGSGEAPRAGRPARALALTADTPRVILIQLGVRRTRLTVAPLAPVRDDAIAWEIDAATPRSVAGFEKLLAKHADALCDRLPGGRPLAAAVSLPGMHRADIDRSLFSPNLRWTTGQSLGQLVGAAFGCPAQAAQEIRVLAAGHHAAAGDDPFLLFDAGRGVGAAVVVDGRVYRSPLGCAGEIGHTPVPGGDRPCGCGQTGCLETLLSRPGLIGSHGRGDPDDRAAWPRLLADLADAKSQPAWLIRTLDHAADIVTASLNAFGLADLVCTGALAELPEPARDRFADRVAAGCVAGRFSDARIAFAPRRRALGLLTLLATDPATPFLPDLLAAPLRS